MLASSLLASPSLSFLLRDWQLGETDFWVLGLVDNVFSVTLYKMFLNIREIAVIQENEMSHFFFQRAAEDISIWRNSKRKALYSFWG